MTLQPTQNCVIVKPDIEKHKLFALLRDKQTGTGVVTYVGPDVEELKIGNRVLFGDSIGYDFKWDDQNYLIMRESHVLGVFDE